MRETRSRPGEQEEYVLGDPGEYAGRAAQDVRAIHQTEKAGRRTSIVEVVFARRCAGYRVKPDPGALAEGIRTAGRAEAGRRAALAWLREADEGDIIDGWWEELYTIEDLVRCMQVLECRTEDGELVRTLNAIARR